MKNFVRLVKWLFNPQYRCPCMCRTPAEVLQDKQEIESFKKSVFGIDPIKP